MVELRYPFTEDVVRALKAGEAVSVNGKVWTGRDRFHKHFADGGKLPVDFRDGALYHCGPVVIPPQPPQRSRSELPQLPLWHVVAAGPTTSVRENPYEPSFIAKTGLRLVIGKGGMDERTLDACRKCGAVYLQAVGGAAALAAKCITRVTNVYFLDEFGAAEACWEFEMKDFRCVVAMDSHGKSLFEDVRRTSEEQLQRLKG